MNEILIEDSVYFLKLNTIDHYTKRMTKFKTIFTKQEKERLIDIYKRNKINLFNGRSARLDKIVLNDYGCTLEISEINYFDSIISNILYFDAKPWLDNCLNDEEIGFYSNQLNKIKSKINGHKSIYDVINNEYISNIMSVSVLVKDKNGKLGITKRTSSLNLSAGLVSTTVTGSVDGEAFEQKDPLLYSVEKEVIEELGTEVNQIKLKGIAISKTKLQPIILFDAEINESWDDVIKRMKSATDYKKEIDKFLVTSISELPELLDNNKLSDATRYHIYLKYKDSLNN